MPLLEVITSGPRGSGPHLPPPETGIQFPVYKGRAQINQTRYEDPQCTQEHANALCDHVRRLCTVLGLRLPHVMPVQNALHTQPRSCALGLTGKLAEVKNTRSGTFSVCLCCCCCHFFKCAWISGSKTFCEFKFMCLRYSGAKQTKMLEFGAEKGLLQGPCKEIGRPLLRIPSLPMGFREDVLIHKIWGESCRPCNPPLVGWW